MSEVSKPFFTIEEYLAHEQKVSHKSEYHNGEIFLMAGGSETHNAIVYNLAVEFRQVVRERKCRAYVSDMKVVVKEFDFSTYPDVTVVCSDVKFFENHEDAITNPTVLVEVLSNSTRVYDLTTKFKFYQALTSLQHYILVEQREVMVIHHYRLPDNKWGTELLTDLSATLTLSDVGVQIPLQLIYDNIEFKQPKRKLLRHPKSSDGEA